MFRYEILKSLMAEHKITPAQLSRETKISQTLLTQWKQGRQSPSIEYAEKLADYFDVPVDYILGVGLYSKQELFEEHRNILIKSLKNVKFDGFPNVFFSAMNEFLQSIDSLPIYKQIEFFNIFIKDINYDEDTNALKIHWNFK